MRKQWFHMQTSISSWRKQKDVTSHFKGLHNFELCAHNSKAKTNAWRLGEALKRDASEFKGETYTINR